MSTLQLPADVERGAVSVDDYLRSRWDAAAAAKMDPVQRLIYRSNLLGADAWITNTGGGNTSSKIDERDPITGETVRVLWVKGSGGDLRTATKANFASLALDQVLALRDVYARFPERGAKTAAEDAMVAMYPYTTFDRNATAPSIDTPLHAFIPALVTDTFSRTTGQIVNVDGGLAEAFLR
jgi:rhamnose utilization protein RhaD (predicted bifunctional aldolase and dehydrogenase)